MINKFVLMDINFQNVCISFENSYRTLNFDFYAIIALTRWLLSIYLHTSICIIRLYPGEIEKWLIICVYLDINFANVWSHWRINIATILSFFIHFSPSSLKSNWILHSLSRTIKIDVNVASYRLRPRWTAPTAVLAPVSYDTLCQWLRIVPNRLSFSCLKKARPFRTERSIVNSPIYVENHRTNRFMR